jgi:acetyltransferase-like isoleucine patch superfamily enzyme
VRVLVWIDLPPEHDRVSVAGLALSAMWDARLAAAGARRATSPGGSGGAVDTARVDGRAAALTAADLQVALARRAPILRVGPGDATETVLTVHGATAAEPLVRAALELPRLDEPGGVAAAERQARADAVLALVAGGVHVVDPARTLVDPSARVAAGAVIWPDVAIRGTSAVAAGAEIRPGCWIEDSEIDEGATILPHSVISGAHVGPGCTVGPMAHLRPGARLVGANKVGNFVEVKQSTLGLGAKASHLTYLGDAEVGADANIGAGTITCNYDGFRKHRTTIGERAFIGSNSAIVAPVSVGAGAIVGAGSVITRDVPDAALAVERAEQRVHPGMARKLNDRNARRKRQERDGEGEA